jgi:CRISPR-associated protein Csx3
MSTYLTELDGKILQVGFGQPADNDRIVRDATDQIDQLIANGEMTGGEILCINGRASMPVGFAIAAKVGHIFGAIAVSDPKLGKDTFVVAITHSPTYKLGEVLRLDAENEQNTQSLAKVSLENLEDSKALENSSSFFVKLEGNVLLVDFNRLQEVSNDRLVKDASAELDRLMAAGELRGGELLKINGPISLPVSFVVSHRVWHLYKAIAMFDPKMSRYVVTSSHDPQYRLGDTIFFDELTNPARVRVVLCGAANSGKSCLREGLKQALWNLKSNTYPYVITAQPDGDGCFTFETYRYDATYASDLKQTLKSQSQGFKPEFVHLVAGWVRNASLPLTLVDVGGQISSENKLIMSEATHAIILSKTQSEIDEWRSFCQSFKPRNLEVIAEIHSILDGDGDRFEETDSLLTGEICGINRGVDLSERPIVKALALRLVALVKSMEGGIS